MAKTATKPRRAIALGQTALLALSEDVEHVSVARGFKMSVNGLDISGQPSMEACEAVGLKLRVGEKGAPFALGDFINYVEDRWGEEAAQIIDAEQGWSEKTCNVYRWVSKRIAKERRRMDKLGIKHHLLVAALTPSKQAHWLAKAADDAEGPWTTARLAKALHSDEPEMPETLWVLVKAVSEQDQNDLMVQLEAQGRTVKATRKRIGKAKETVEA